MFASYQKSILQCLNTVGGKFVQISGTTPPEEDFHSPKAEHLELCLRDCQQQCTAQMFKTACVYHLSQLQSGGEDGGRQLKALQAS